MNNNVIEITETELNGYHIKKVYNGWMIAENGEMFKTCVDAERYIRHKMLL